MESARGARVLVVSGSVTTLDYVETDDPTPTDDSDWFTPADSDATMTVAVNQSIALPDSSFASGHIRLIGDAACVVRLVRKG